MLGKKSHDVVDAIRTKGLAVVIGHERLVVKDNFLNLRFIEQVQVPLDINHLDGVIGIISGHAPDFSSVLPNDRHRLESDVRRSVRIHNSLPQLFGGHLCANIGKVGPENAARAANSVAIAAMRLPVIKLAPGFGIARDGILRDRIIQASQKRRYLPSLVVWQIRRRHAGTGNALLDDMEQPVVRHSLQIAVFSQIGTAAAFPFRTVASCASLFKTMLARFNCLLLSGERIHRLSAIANCLPVALCKTHTHGKQDVCKCPPHYWLLVDQRAALPPNGSQVVMTPRARHIHDFTE